MKVNGYCFDNKKLIDTVNGYSSLSPSARHALRDIFDKIWEDVTMSVPNDASLVSYTGFNKTEWVHIVNELVTLNRKFIMLIDGNWRSPWLESQRSFSDQIQHSNPSIGKSFEILEDFEDDEFEEFSPVGAERENNLSSGRHIKNSNKKYNEEDFNSSGSDGFTSRAKKIGDRLINMRHRG